MRGHLKNRDVNYTIVIYHGKDPVTGQKKYTWHSCNQILGRKASKKEAETLLTEMLKQVADDKFIVPEKITLREYLTDHWLPHIKKTVRENTYRTYEMMARNHLIPNLGGQQLSKIKPVTLQKLYNTLAEEGNRKDGKEGTLSARTMQQATADKIEQALYPHSEETKKLKKKKYILTKKIGFAKD